MTRWRKLCRRAVCLATAGLWVALSATLTPAVAAPQAAAPDAPAAGFGEQVGVSWVLVPVVVRAQNGGSRERLSQADFKLMVDGREVRIDTFERRAEAPLSVVFLQDLSGSMGSGGRLEASREVVRTFLETAHGGDEFALASFAGGLSQVDVPFTDDLRTLREAIAAWEAYGTTALHDAVAWLPDISLSGRNPKRAAILVTDGADNASRLTPDDARDIVRRSQLPVYVLGLDSGDPFRLDAAGHKLYRYADVLNLLAYASGGQYHAVHGPEDLKEACEGILEDLRSQYVLSFPTAGAGSVKDHVIRVEVKAKNVRVFFRRGYRGLPPAVAVP